MDSHLCLNTLCPDMLYHIVTYLSWADAHQLRQVSRTLFRVVERVWERKLSSDFSYLTEHSRQCASAHQEYRVIQELMEQAPAVMKSHLNSFITDIDPQLIGEYMLVSLYYPAPPFNVLRTKTGPGLIHIVLHDILINRINNQMHSVVPNNIDCLLVSYQFCDRELYQGTLPKIGVHLSPKSPQEFFGQDLFQALLQEGVLCKENDHIFDMSVASELVKDIESKGYLITDEAQYTSVRKMRREPHIWEIIDEC